MQILLKAFYSRLVTLGFTTFLLLQSTHLKAEVIVLANGQWPPFLSQKQPFGGFAAHIVSEAFEHMGYQVFYKYYPWARAEHLVKHNQIQGSVVWSITPKRQSYAWFSDPVITLKAVAFHVKSQPFEWQQLADFKGKSICLPMGSADDFFKPLIAKKQIRIERPSNIEAGFRLLLKGRCDIMTISKAVGYYTLRQAFSKDLLAKFRYSQKPIKSLNYSLMLSNQRLSHRALIIEFNSQLKHLKQSGRLAQMQAHFDSGGYDTIDLPAHQGVGALIDDNLSGSRHTLP